MKTLTARLAGGLGFVGVTGTAVAGVWYMNQPKDVKSKLVSEGFTLVGSSSRAWRAIFLTLKDDSGFISFSGAQASDDSKEAGPKVMSFCEKVLNVASGSEDYASSLEKARKYCTVPTFKTVEAKVLFSDKEIATGDEDWQNIFVLNKGDNDFITKVNATPNLGGSIQSGTGASDAKDKVKKYCDSLKDESPNSGNIVDYEKYCLQTPSNIKDFYEKKGHKFVGNGGNWGSKFDAIKGSNDGSLFTDIQNGGSLNQNSLASDGGPKLQSWCNTKVASKIHEADPSTDENQKVKTRCFD